MSAGLVIPGPSEWVSEPEPVRAISFGDLLEGHLARAKELAEARRSGRRPGPTTGFAGLDAMLGGWQRPGLYALHAEGGVGKSALLLQMAVDSGFGALYVSAEMPAEVLFRRHLARANRVNSEILGAGTLDEERERAFAEAGVLQAMKLRILDGTEQAVTPSDISREVRHLRGEYGHVMVVVDSIQPWCESNGAELGLSEYDSIARGIAALRRLATATQSPVWFLSERNKTAREGMGAMAGHRRLAHGPDVVMELVPESDEEAYARGHFGDVQTVTLKVNKNRNGRRGVLKYTLTGGIQEFAEQRWGQAR